jgi:hypothetical protein
MVTAMSPAACIYAYVGVHGIRNAWPITSQLLDSGERSQRHQRPQPCRTGSLMKHCMTYDPGSAPVCRGSEKGQLKLQLRALNTDRQFRSRVEIEGQHHGDKNKRKFVELTVLTAPVCKSRCGPGQQVT